MTKVNSSPRGGKRKESKRSEGEEQPKRQNDKKNERKENKALEKGRHAGARCAQTHLQRAVQINQDIKQLPTRKSRSTNN